MLRYRLSLPWLLALRSWRMLAKGGGGFRILLFHHLAAKDVEAFSDFVGYLKQFHGLLTPEQAAAWAVGGAEKARGAGETGNGGRVPCLVTFDDGFASNFDIAREVLGRHRVKALFFVCPGLVGLAEDDQRRKIAANIFEGRQDAASQDVRLMTWGQIAELRSMGHAIGAHGMTHRRLSALEGEELRREIQDCASELRDRLGCAPEWFAYAFGDAGSVSREALKIVSESFRFCRSGVRGVNGAVLNPYALRADHVDLAAPPSYRKLTVEGGLDGRYAGARKALDEMAAQSPARNV